MKENQITLITADGEEQLANILFTHEKDYKTYVVFEFVESKEISAARYEENEAGSGEILDIETDEEWEMLDKLLDSYYDELEEVNSEADLFDTE